MNLSTAELYAVAILFVVQGIGAIMAGKVRPRAASSGDLGYVVQVLGILSIAAGALAGLIYLWRVLG